MLIKRDYRETAREETFNIKDYIRAKLKVTMEKNLIIFGWEILENGNKKAADMIEEVT